ncbi:hypothetical protein HYC85_019268 [Camellia sinensis]|uniref:DUF789 domain-containing protein n=1 Tax=Camellia sinensis TaxID=4442 RepID=A0A7J7GQ88_CAMSI|nr:hypothetical protein HYC85_019268 [Camellia sinensis]
MSVSGGGRNRGGDDRFYSPPAMRRHYQQQQQQQQSQLNNRSKSKSKPSSVESEKRIESEDCSSSTATVAPSVSSSFSPPRTANLTNLDRFLEHTTPIVPAQYFSKTSMRGWRLSEDEFHPYFVLGDLWESFKEWSAYGAGVPLVLNGSDSVVQYYVPYLSGIQLYIDPSKPSMRLSRPGEESDADSSRESSSDGSSECGAERGANDVQGSWSQQNTMRATTQNFHWEIILSMGSTVDEGEIRNPPGLLVFEYLEHNPPFNREPLADKASTSSDSPDIHVSTARELHGAGMSFKLLLPIFGLASYKFNVSDWNPNGVHECQKTNSLLQAANNWLHLLHVNHPDYRFFVSHNSNWR